MRKLSEYVLGRLMTGALVVAPIYLAALLLLKGAKSLTGVLKPFAYLLPNWLPAAEVLRGGAGHLLFDWTGGAYPDRICTAESSGEIVL